MQLPSVQPRGVALAALFMAGVEVAQFANDVCGAPVTWNMVCPWQFFDGKLFHFKLLKAKNNTPLVDMCDGQVSCNLRFSLLFLKISFCLAIFFLNSDHLLGQYYS